MEIIIAIAGETPAYVTDWYAHLYYQGNEAAFWPQMERPIVRSANLFWLEPGETRPLGAQFERDGAAHAIFVEGKAELFVVGTIKYQGKDEIARITGFCRR